MSQKKKIIVVYPAMMIGGSTTSLLSILNRLDYSKYDVDLLLNSYTGELLDKIPSQVNLLPPALKYINKKEEYLHRLLSPRYMIHFVISKLIIKRDKVDIHGAQYLEMKDVEFFRLIPDEYDVALAFLEGAQCKFVARHIRARRKIAWIHINYLDGKFEPKYDRESMATFNKVVLVSNDCKIAFDKAFPELSDRSLVVENILSTEFVRSMAQNPIDFVVDQDKVNLVTVCRINFKSKGLDRAVDAMAKLKSEGNLNNIVWYVLGDGPDFEPFKSMIKDNNLEEYIIPLGMQKNPYKYLKNMSLFFLPSRWEGKPMAVTEAFMMELPVLVTEYSSAHEQVRHDVDGYIVENSTDGIYQGLEYILAHQSVLKKWKENVKNKDYSNVFEINKVEKLIDGIEF
jgi:glycosyltransferase involved in cell wall biosynthesis